MDIYLDDPKFMFEDSLNDTQPTVPEYDEKKDAPFLSSFIVLVTDITFLVVLCFLIGIFGTVANIINIIVYYRQGVLSCGSNLNLFSLSVADLGVSVFTFLHSIGFALVIADTTDLPFDPFSVTYLAIGFPLLAFTTANRLLTAYVAFERCLCVVLPFHIKSMFTIGRSLFYIITIYTYVILSHLPMFVVTRFGFEMDKSTNISKLVLIYAANRELVHFTVFYANNFVVSIATVVIVFVCTVVTSAQIKTSKEWRKSVSRITKDTTGINHSSTYVKDKESPENGENKDKKMADDTIDKETRLVKMITTVSVIFLLCYIWDLLMITTKAVDSRIDFNKPYYRLAKLIYSLALVFTLINSSVNIFIYYRMSSRYRKEFQKLFGMYLYSKR